MSSNREVDMKKITMEEAKAHLAADKSIVLLDVRGRDEFKEGHIEGAINIPLPLIFSEIEEEVPDKDTKIYLYCRSGVRTITAADVLLEMGYREVYDMGGIIYWPYDIVR